MKMKLGLKTQALLKQFFFSNQFFIYSLNSKSFALWHKNVWNDLQLLEIMTKNVEEV